MQAWQLFDEALVLTEQLGSAAYENDTVTAAVQYWRAVAVVCMDVIG